VVRVFQLPLRALRMLLRPVRMLLRALRSFLLFVIRRDPSTPLEFLLALFLIILFLSSWEIRSLAVRWAVAIIGGFWSACALLWIDTRGTAFALGLTFLKVMPGVVPVLVLFWRLRGWERLRIPLWCALLPFFGPLACTGEWTASRTMMIILFSIAAVWLTKYRFLRWTVWLPLFAYAQIFVVHTLAHAKVEPWWGSRSELMARCSRNDGQRPLNLREEQVGLSYFSADPLNDSEVLLTNAGPSQAAASSGAVPEHLSSWWLRRLGEGWVFDGRSAIAGYLENGCVIGDEIWVNDAEQGFVAALSWDASTRRERIRKFPLNLGWRALDFAPPVCRPAEERVIVTEATYGTRMLEVSTTTGTVRDMNNKGYGLMWAAQGRRDRYLTVNTSSGLILYSLDREQVVERIPAGVFMYDQHDLCPLDNEVVTADMTGRVRLFSETSDGHYRFDWGISLPSPRNTAFSPDCRFIGVTSNDDTTVSIVDREKRSVIATYRAGPTMREITFLGPREVAIADACTMTTFRF
jgi:hypothetical protein